MTRSSNSLSIRRQIIPRPLICRKYRRGKVLGYGIVPGFGLTLREIEDALLLPHTPSSAFSAPTPPPK